jgi:hypothetical protein
MVRVEGRDLAFDVPGDWNDRSVTAFSAPHREGVPVVPNLVVTRDVVTTPEPVASYADRQLVEMARRLDAFNLVVRQSQIFVIRHNTVLSFVLTALESDFSAYETTFNAILGTVNFKSTDQG